MNLEQLDNANKRTTEGGVKGNFFPRTFSNIFQNWKKNPVTRSIQHFYKSILLYGIINENKETSVEDKKVK